MCSPRCLFSLALLVISAVASCYDPSPAFPVPLWSNGADILAHAFKSIEQKLKDIVADEKYDGSSFSIEVTSNSAKLWSHFHTARKRNETRPGAEKVDENSIYRIASISKIFTTLAVLYQHEAGELNLDSPIIDYVPDLAGEIPWQDITLRILATQLSGIPREFAQSDAINEIPDPTVVGLPPISKDELELPTCDEYNDYIPCKRKDLLKQLKRAKPFFAPNQKSTYSNLNFELLGLAIESVTGESFEDHIKKTIFKPLNMTSTTLKKPADTHAVLPIGQYYWDVDGGVQNPTGGIYSSLHDMGNFVRYILTHYNAIATGVNWMMPASWSTGMNTFYGMPFEIFRTDAILQHQKRPVTFVSKSGGLPAYFSRITMLPEYGLGLTALVGGVNTLLAEIQETVTVELVRAAEAAIWDNVWEVYTGSYIAVDSSLNTSMELTSSPSTGLIFTSFISNGTDIVKDVIPMFLNWPKSGRGQLVPTLLFKDEEMQQGEIWRFIGVKDREPGVEKGVWDAFCVTDDDIAMYAGLPVNEIVFWHEDGVIELPAWRVKMKRAQRGDKMPGMVIQSGNA